MFSQTFVVTHLFHLSTTTQPLPSLCSLPLRSILRRRSWNHGTCLNECVDHFKWRPSMTMGRISTLSHDVCFVHAYGHPISQALEVASVTNDIVIIQLLPNQDLFDFALGAKSTTAEKVSIGCYVQGDTVSAVVEGAWIHCKKCLDRERSCSLHCSMGNGGGKITWKGGLPYEHQQILKRRFARYC